MATNARKIEGRLLPLTCSHPTTPTSGCPVRIGGITGVAVTDERTAGDTTVDLAGVYDLSVKGENDAGNVAVAAGDALYYVDADVDDGTGTLSKKVTGYFFGYALEGVNSGSTSTIEVLNVTAPGAGLADIPAGAVGGTELATGLFDVYSADGQDETMDATYTVTGVATTDEIWGVLFISTKASVATIAVLDPAGFTVTSANTITAGTPVDRSNDQLIFFVTDKN